MCKPDIRGASRISRPADWNRGDGYKGNRAKLFVPARSDPENRLATLLYKKWAASVFRRPCSSTGNPIKSRYFPFLFAPSPLLPSSICAAADTFTGNTPLKQKTFPGKGKGCCKKQDHPATGEKKAIPKVLSCIKATANGTFSGKSQGQLIIGWRTNRYRRNIKWRGMGTLSLSK